MNQHNLSRNIPEPVKRAVRQRDGFGCVVCGSALIEYEHFDPEYKDAKEHNVDGIILLCVSCHSRKTRGRLSRQTIEKARLNPKAKQTGFSFGAFDVGDQAPQIVLGNIVATNVAIVLSIFGDENFKVEKPEFPGGPFRISAKIYDRHSRKILEIIENEWKTPTSNWDVTVEGRFITIRSNIRSIDLVLRTDPPDMLTVERLKMTHRGFTIESTPHAPTRITLPSGDVLETNGVFLNGCRTAIEVTERGFSLGVGGGSMFISEMVMNPHSPAPTNPNPPAPTNIVPFRRR